MTEESSRKLAVLLHADVNSSTALVQLDETVAHDRFQDVFRRFSETINQHNGTTHEIRGDALIAEFSKASDAVSAALEFQTANQKHNIELQDEIRPTLRVGIAMGEVVIADNTVTGEGIVLAQRLEQLAEPGGVCVQGAAYETIPKRFPFEFRNLGDKPVKGFNEPVRVYAVSPESEGVKCEQQTVSHREASAPDLPEKPSIAVLPFNNMSSDPEQEYFSDGITEDIITELSRFRSLFVIARNSSFAYKGQKVDIRKIGHELGVRYVLEGSVRRAGESVRITAQLIEAQSGNHCWAERYDRQLDDVFAVQEEVSRTIVATLLRRVEQDRLEIVKMSRPENLAAHDHLLRGKTYLYRYTKENIQSAINCFQNAVEASPEYSEAYAWLSLCHSWLFAGWWSNDPATSLDTALELAIKSVEMDSTIGQAHGSLAYALVYKREYDKAMHHFERAITLVPSDAENTSNFGWCLMFDGNPEKGLLWIEKGERLNPLQEWWHAWLRGMVFYTMSHYNAALEAFGQLRLPPVEVEGWRSACYAQIDNIDRAKETIEIFKQRAETEFSIYPGDKDGGWRDYWYRTQPFRKIEDQEHLFEGLQKAGLSI